MERLGLQIGMDSDRCHMPPGTFLFILETICVIIQLNGRYYFPIVDF